MLEVWHIIRLLAAFPSARPHGEQAGAKPGIPALAHFPTLIKQEVIPLPHVGVSDDDAIIHLPDVA